MTFILLQIFSEGLETVQFRYHIVSIFLLEETFDITPNSNFHKFWNHLNLIFICEQTNMISTIVSGISIDTSAFIYRSQFFEFKSLSCASLKGFKLRIIKHDY